MAVDCFMKIGDIVGESKDGKHKEWIEVTSWWWKTSKMQSTGTAKGRAVADDFHFTTSTGLASPRLMQACYQNTVFPVVTMVCRKAGAGGQQEYFLIKFKEAGVCFYKAAMSSENPTPTDEIALTFRTIELTAKEQKADGTLGGGITTEWDVRVAQ